MPNVIALDYETYYKKADYSVRDLGNWGYCRDSRFDAYLLSVTDGSESWVGHPREFNWDAIAPEDLLIAHNAAFDSAVTRRLTELGIAPDLKNRWQCTANLASFISSTRSLAGAVFVLEGRRIDKGIRDWMSGKTWADAVAAGKAKSMEEYALADTVECWNLWNKYSSRWPKFEQELSSLTMTQCARGVAINTELLEEYRTRLALVVFNLGQSFPWVTRGQKPTSPLAIAEECRTVGIPTPPVKKDDEEGFNDWERTFGPQFPWVRGVGQWRQLNKLLATLETIRGRLRPDGTIDFSLLYFGAHTGRWSGGGGGLNLQNLRKVPLYLKDNCLVTPPDNLSPKDFKDWAAANTDYVMDIRGLFVARPGKKFIIADLSQIEPRVLAWLTGNAELLGMLKSGMSIYEAFARVSMGWKGGNLKKENPDLYQLAKIQVLGLGYGCGWEKFITIAAGYGVNLTDEKSKELVALFREQNPRITGLWRTLDDAYRSSDGGDFTMSLPSGRALVYRDVRRDVRSKRNPETGKYEKRFVFTAAIGEKRVENYGGKLTENLVQATARDVFGEHLLDLEKNVGDVIFHVHDEAIVEVDPDVTTKDVEHVMSRCPDWLEGCPVSVEARETTRYLK